MPEALFYCAGVYARLKDKFPAADERVVAAHTELLTERLLAHIRNVAADAPPWTDEQIGRIAAVLAGR